MKNFASFNDDEILELLGGKCTVLLQLHSRYSRTSIIRTCWDSSK